MCELGHKHRPLFLGSFNHHWLIPVDDQQLESLARRRHAALRGTRLTRVVLPTTDVIPVMIFTRAQRTLGIVSDAFFQTRHFAQIDSSRPAPTLKVSKRRQTPWQRTKRDEPFTRSVSKPAGPKGRPASGVAPIRHDPLPVAMQPRTSSRASMPSSTPSTWPHRSLRSRAKRSSTLATFPSDGPRQP